MRQRIPLGSGSMQKLVQRAWFRGCALLGRLLRAAGYSVTTIVRRDGGVEVRKRRGFHAPLLISLGGLLMTALRTGVRILPQREWEEREHFLYTTLHGASIRRDLDGTLILPRLPGRTLAALLEDPSLAASARTRAMELAAASLAAFHGSGFTHADAMADNVIVDLEAGVARWFDFETVHEPGRSIEWRRADDVRALVATCLLRSAPDDVQPALHLLLDAYGDAAIRPELADMFNSVMRPMLVFHLAQAGLSFERYGSIHELLRKRADGGS